MIADDPKADGKAGRREKSASKDDMDIVREALDRWQDGYDREADNIKAAQSDLEFRSGEAKDQWDAGALADRSEQKRPVIVVNKIPKFIRTVTGDIRKMKPAIKVVPVDDDSDPKVANVLAGLIRYIEGRSEARVAYSQAADSQVTCGMGAVQIVTEYAGQTTFDTELRIMPIDDPVMVMWDPDSTLLTREDARWCIVPVDISRKRFEADYPDHTASSFAHLADHQSYSTWVSDDHVRVADYWCKKPITRRLALMPDGVMIDVTDEPDAEKQAVALGAEVRSRRSEKIVRYRLSAAGLLDEPEDWPGRYIPVVPFIGEEVRMGRRTYRHGVVRYMKDPQRRVNYFASAEVESYALAPKSPWLATEEQIEPYSSEWETANQHNHSVLRYRPVPGHPPPQRIPPPPVAVGFMEATTRATQDMMDVSGIYEASLGRQGNEKSGRAIQARQAEGDTTTYVYVDNFGLAIRQVARILIDLIPHVYDTQRTVRIVGDDGSIDKITINQPAGVDGAESGVMRRLNDVTTGSYDVAVEMGPSFATKKQESLEGMIALMQASPNIVPLMLDQFVKAMDMPGADKIAARVRAMLPAPIKMLEQAEEAGATPEEAQRALDQQMAQQAQNAPPPPEAIKAQAAQIKAQADIQKAGIDLEGQRMRMAEKAMDIQMKQADHEFGREERQHDIDLKKLDALMKVFGLATEAERARQVAKSGADSARD